MIIDSIVNVFTGVIESVMMFMLYEAFFIRRSNIPKWIYGIGAGVLAVMINICNIYFSYAIWNIVGMILAFFTVSFLYKGNIPFKAILSVLNCLIIGIIEVIVLFVITIIYNVTVTEVLTDSAYRILGTIVSKMLALLVINIIRLKFKKNALHIDSPYWVLFLIMFISSITTIFLIFKLSYSINNDALYNMSVISSFGLLSSTFLALYLYEHLAKQSEIIREQQQYEQNLKLQLKHLDEILVTQNKIKKFKHDFSNYVIGLQSYIDNSDCDGANAYISKLKEIFNPNECIVETGNITLDAIISTKKAIAESKNIEFTTKIQIPKQMNVDPVDICVIFGNALDNSIEACERINDKNKKISLTVICQDEMVFCKIINTAPKPKKTLEKTSKTDKKNHGFGLENIKTALLKYNSEPTILHTENEFTLKFVIFLRG